MKPRNPKLLASNCPSCGGAYILEMNVPGPLSVKVGRLGMLDVEPGRYLYVGSAYGPGGIAARVTRHLNSKGRRMHWHIDHLSSTNGVDRVWVVPQGNECEIVSTLLTSIQTFTPFTGFGSSDCRQCPAHLLMASPHLAIGETIARAVNVFDAHND